jgi:hypothetical protein
MISQKQRGGIGSKNFQVTIENKGMSYQDVRDIAKDVFTQNFELLSREALATTEQRAEKIRSDIVEALSADLKAKLETFKEPDRQVALLDAQKAYVLTGDEDLRKMLVRMVTDLSREDGRNLRSIVIEEAIKTVATLTPRQIQILATVYINRYVNFSGAHSVAFLAQRYFEALFDRISRFEGSIGDLRHIEYAGCGKITLMQHNFADVMRENYAGLFQRGLSENDINAKFGSDGVPRDASVLCLNDLTQIQIAALNEQVILAKSKSFNWTENQKLTAIAILKENSFDNTQILAMLQAVQPRFDELNQHWSTSALNKFELTSVGIAIAHSYVSSSTEFNDLSIWL